MAEAKKSKKAEIKAVKYGDIIVASGKKKTAIARASIKPGTGMVTINKSPYKNLSYLRMLMIEEPVMIARALVQFTKSDALRKAFLDYDRNMLIADTRRKEMRKPSSGKARKKRQKSYR